MAPSEVVRPKLDIVDEFKNVVATLTQAKLEFALCGGFAVVIYGYIRATKDIDLLVEEARVEPVFSALKTLGFTLRAGPIGFGAGTAHERTLYRATKVVEHEHLTIDLLVVTPVFADVWANRGRIEWSGLTIDIVSKEGLATMKRLAGRKQDLADLEALGLPETI